jgi:hypothetical protein
MPLGGTPVAVGDAFNLMFVFIDVFFGAREGRRRKRERENEVGKATEKGSKSA